MPEDMAHAVKTAVAEERLSQAVRLLREVLSMEHPAVYRADFLHLIHAIESFQDRLYRDDKAT